MTWLLDGKRTESGALIDSLHATESRNGCGGLAFANAAFRGSAQQRLTTLRNNVEFERLYRDAHAPAGLQTLHYLQDNPHLIPYAVVIAARAVRDVAKGEEIFVDYGNDYWDPRLTRG